MRTYEDFELWISAEEEGGYRVRATGAGEEQRFVLDAKALTERWNRLARAFTGRDRATPEEIEDAEALGSELFRAVFADKILFAWGAALTRAAAKGKRSGVRLVLHVQEAGPLAALPWELLFESQNRGPLAISPKTPILRYPDVQERPRPLAQDPPLRLLGVLAEPLGQPLLDLEGEWQEIEKAVAPICGRGLIEVERLVSPTLPKLRERLKQEPAIHAIHFAGHGIAGALDLEREGRNRRVEPALGQQLATLLDDAPELRLVVINACEGAVGSGGESTTSLAFHLARRGLPAVVALQSAVSDQSARLFARAFYKVLAKGGPLEVAVTEAREALHDDHRGLAWASPLLYLRAPTGQLFKGKPWIYRWLPVTLALVLIATIGIALAAYAGNRIVEKAIHPPSAHALKKPISSPNCPSPPGLDFAFVEIEPGSFDMGAPAGRGDLTEEQRAHQVTLTLSFCVGAFEVTKAQWNAVSAHRSTALRPGIDMPQVGVSWTEVQQFLSNLRERDPSGGYRLLTEAEFEFSTRAGSFTDYSFGDNADDLPQYGNCLPDDRYKKLAPIGSFKPNPLGLYDLHGNAQEWVADWFDLYPSNRMPQVDPRGPEAGSQRVRRGGSFESSAANCTSWSRSYSDPDRHQKNLGFRIARSPRFRANGKVEKSPAPKARTQASLGHRPRTGMYRYSAQG